MHSPYSHSPRAGDGERAARLQARLEALPARCRQVLVLYRFDGLSPGDIAQQLGMSSERVAFHLRRALLACRQADAQGSP